MARASANAFVFLRSNPAITNLREQTVVSRQQAMREHLKRDFVVKDTFLTEPLPPQHNDRSMDVSPGNRKMTSKPAHLFS